MIEIMINLQGGARTPLYEKIYNYIKKEITEGRIPQGEKLPSTRLLARHLSVSRSTVEMAYEQLLAEGYIKAEPCRGFFVCDITELYRLGCAGKENAAEKPDAEPDVPKEENHARIDFSPYTVDTRHFPYNIWRKVSKAVLLDDREELLLSGDGQGDYGLRRAIAGYLHQARGVNCRPEQVIIGAGNEYLEILLMQILKPGQRVLMENPTYLQAYRTFDNMGCEMLALPAGDFGMDAGRVRACRPDIVYVMPSHQFPLGAVMPLEQRLALLKWASEGEERYLIEDDHDSEYRYRGKPIPSLQSVDSLGKVIYIGTFSKSIAPSLRVSYMVLPPRLLERYRKSCGFYSATVPRIEQEILKTFIEEGHFERHLNKMRGIYRAKHDFLLGELKKRSWVEKVQGDHAGLHVLVHVKTGYNEQELCRFAAERGVKLSGLSEHLIPAREEEKRRQEAVLLLGYGKPDEEEIRTGLGVLDAVLAEHTV